MTRRLLAVAILIGSLAGATTASATAHIVPSITATLPQGVSSETPAQSLTGVPQPATTPQPTTAPVSTAPPSGKTTAPINNDVASQFFTLIIDDTVNLINGVLPAIVQISVTFFKLITVISISFLIMGVMLDGGNLASAARVLLPRFIEFSLLFVVITQMWTGIAWFPAMLNWGLSLASHIAGTPFPVLSIQTANGINATSFDQIPGTLVGLGGDMYHIIMKGSDDGNSGLWGWVKRIAGLATGNTEVYMALVIYLWITALHALGSMTYAALRVTASVVNALLLTPMSFLQATLGSRRLASLGGGYINGTIVMMLELMLTVLIAGLSIIVLKTLAGALSWQVTNGYSLCGTADPTICFTTSTTVTIAEASLINLAVGVISYMITRVPKTVGDLLAGRLTMSGSEVTAVLRSMSGNPIGFGLSAAGSAIEGTAKGGVGTGLAAGTEGIRGLLGSAAKFGLMVAVGAATGGVGAGAVAEAGAMGGMMGGAPGALAGAAGKLLSSSMANSGEEAPDAGGTIDSSPQAGPTPAVDAAANNDGSNTDASTQNDAQASRSGNVTTDWNDQNTTPPTPPNQSTSQTQTRNVNTATNYTSAGGSDSNGGAAAPNASTSGLGGILRDLNPGMSVGRMFAQRMIYSQGRSTPPPPTPPEESATTNVTPFG